MRYAVFFFSWLIVSPALGARSHEIVAHSFWSKNSNMRVEVDLVLPKNSLNLDRVLYGNKKVGYRALTSYQILGRNLKVSIRPLCYKLPTYFYMETATGLQYLGKKSFKSPWLGLDKVFRKIGLDLQGSYYFLLVAAIPGIGDARSSKRLVCEDIQFISVVNSSGETIWAYTPKFDSNFAKKRLTVRQDLKGNLYILDDQHMHLKSVNFEGRQLESIHLSHKVGALNIIHDWQIIGKDAFFLLGKIRANDGLTDPLQGVHAGSSLILRKASLQGLVGDNSHFKTIYDGVGSKLINIDTQRNKNNMNQGELTNIFRPTFTTSGDNDVLVMDPWQQKIRVFRGADKTTIPLNVVPISAKKSGNQVAVLGVKSRKLTVLFLNKKFGLWKRKCQRVLASQSDDRTLTGRVISFSKNKVLIHVKSADISGQLKQLEEQLVTLDGCSGNVQTVLTTEQYAHSTVASIQILNKLWDEDRYR